MLGLTGSWGSGASWTISTVIVAPPFRSSESLWGKSYPIVLASRCAVFGSVLR